MTNRYLEKEMFEITSERNCKNMKKLNRRNEKNIINLTFLIFFFFFAALNAEEEIKMVGHGFFGDTWECKKCGYENYVQIERCGICGHRKGG